MTYDKLNHLYAWNGGECPIHPKTVIDGIERGLYWEGALAEELDWPSFRGAFRIIKLYVEPREFWIVGTLAYQDKRSAITEFPGTTAIHVREVEQPL